VRYYLLGVHYRRPLQFSFDGLDAACRELARLNRLCVGLRQLRTDGEPHREVDELVTAIDAGFWEALREDLSVPQARGYLFAMLRALNSRIANGTLVRADAELALDFLQRADRVLAVLSFDEAAEVGRQAEPA